MCENFRMQVVNMVIKADRIAIYRDLNAQRQLECFIAGTLTGLIGAAMGHVRPEGYEHIVKYIGECIPMAAKFAAGFKNPDGSATFPSNK